MKTPTPVPTPEWLKPVVSTASPQWQNHISTGDESVNIDDRRGQVMTKEQRIKSDLQGNLWQVYNSVVTPESIPKYPQYLGRRAYTDPTPSGEKGKTLGDEIHQWDVEDFLIDTFKRARSTGYPIHALTPYLDGLASSTFSDQGYEDTND